MNRSIILDIDKSTWPTPPSVPVFPPEFHGGAQTFSVHIPSLLLMIGILTTPPENSGPSLSQYWAFVRYLNAITQGQDLRVTRAFSALDAHQKTILSDDFGMGVPMLWLCQTLNIVGFVDGAYFLKNVAALAGVHAEAKGAKGPGKSPDFVLLDAGGNWHVVECKGTQSGRAKRDRQLGLGGANPTGGVAQKQSIIFPSSNTGQRLACGLAVASEKGGAGTHLRVVDPDGSQSFVVEEAWLSRAKQVALIGMFAKSLRLSGFEASANYLSSLSLLNAPMQPRGIRNRHAAERRRLAAAELSSLSMEGRTTLQRGDQLYVGRQINLDLSRVAGPGDAIVAVKAQQGINQRLLGAIARAVASDQSTDALAAVLHELDGRVRVDSDEEGAVFKIGPSFLMDVILRRRQQSLRQ